MSLRRGLSSSVVSGWAECEIAEKPMCLLSAKAPAQPPEATWNDVSSGSPVWREMFWAVGGAAKQGKGPKRERSQEIPGTPLKCLSPKEEKGFNLYKPEGRNKSDHGMEIA